MKEEITEKSRIALWRLGILLWKATGTIMTLTEDINYE